MNKTSKFSLGGGALEPKTVAGVSKKAFYKKKQKAFTLAEVLITLAIIGVVAALTIPTVVANYQKKAYYTAFMKAFNTFTTAKNLAEAEHGSILTWGLDKYSTNRDTIKEKLLPYLKISKLCETNEDCGVTDDLTMSYLNYVPDDPQYAVEYYNNWFNNEDSGADPLFITSDGVMFNIDTGKFSSDNGDLNIKFDTNGIKGPNVFGRDIFYISFYYSKDKPNGSMPTGTLDEAIEACSTEIESDGFGCAYRLILEGKMNY